MLDTSSMNIAASGLTANQLWLNVIANNIANANTTRTPQGGPYRREIVNFAPASQNASFQNVLGATMGTGDGGVQVTSITQDTSPLKSVYDPSSPDAVNGYVQMPNVDIATEMVDMVTASRAYQANATAFDAAKEMDLDALSIGK
ncbi:flagellar basal body rod protein FlgC [Alicyclobacillus fastidiosus]|uniref:Flagellar basal-body rod protein FlgC n=1 Tax=Alicyclobacillus fastidiosus TaxID=392011 RepID=A0ABY6ZBR5_9BACL|nr:flagellar basal body rod protein FlgC [Alicyclobacillus fastidiosus]WAH40213.1 flagellar basal body rod protein FlgC [Alicyclobacillus fastidiosus]